MNVDSIINRQAEKQIMKWRSQKGETLATSPFNNAVSGEVSDRTSRTVSAAATAPVQNADLNLK